MADAWIRWPNAFTPKKVLCVGGPADPGRKVLGVVLGVGYGACILASVVLGLLGYIPEEYMQPVSALYVVPFLVILGFTMRPAGSLVMFLWPALYALHALLVVAGAPIQITGRWEGLNMLLPVAGYGLLAGLAAHLYSRYALHRLKRLTRMELADSNHKGGTSQS